MASTPAARPTPQRSARATAAILTIDRGVYRVARHWLAYVNAWVLGFLGLALLAPVLAAKGFDGSARVIYAIHRPFCHQRDDRSFHVLGEKMACCHRCTAIYGGLFLFGVAFVALRGRLRPLPWRFLALLSLPILLDGLTQAVGLRDSTWELRVLTGSLFAVGAAWLLLPHLERGFADMRRQLETRFARLVAQGRARPLSGAPPLPPAA